MTKFFPLYSIQAHPAVCLVGKSHDFHVEKALGISLDENLTNISKFN